MTNPTPSTATSTTALTQDQLKTLVGQAALQYVVPGEIVGVAGVSGNGQQELMAALSGEDPRAPAGSITLFGQDIASHSPRKRRHEGLYFVPEERLGRGAVPTLSLAANTLLTRTGNVNRSGSCPARKPSDLAKSHTRPRSPLHSRQMRRSSPLSGRSR